MFWLLFSFGNVFQDIGQCNLHKVDNIERKSTGSLQFHQQAHCQGVAWGGHQHGVKVFAFVVSAQLRRHC
jgi:hypothetical protein